MARPPRLDSPRGHRRDCTAGGGAAAVAHRGRAAGVFRPRRIRTLRRHRSTAPGGGRYLHPSLDVRRARDASNHPQRNRGRPRAALTRSGDPSLVWEARTGIRVLLVHPEVRDPDELVLQQWTLADGNLVQHSAGEAAVDTELAAD